eukprot:13813178-Alexandrium_andersonii.AAC.1
MFDTIAQLAVHMRFAHGVSPDHRRAVYTNQCPFCCRVYSTVESTYNHVQTTFRRGACVGRGSYTVFKVLEPGSFAC